MDGPTAIKNIRDLGYKGKADSREGILSHIYIAQSHLNCYPILVITCYGFECIKMMF